MSVNLSAVGSGDLKQHSMKIERSVPGIQKLLLSLGSLGPPPKLVRKPSPQGSVK